jgi:hypothetical protein
MSGSVKKNNKIILKEEYEKLPDDTFYNKDMQKFLLKKELLEKDNRSNQFDFLYPELNDPEFNIKIAQKKEFIDNQYDGSIHDLEKYSDQLCNAEFELNPHQLFVRNFLSFNTPYNSLLLYHGLGTGKTCTAITVAEEMRDYLKQLKIFQRIIVVASPNVQENFKLQLFDERKLELINNIWTIKSNCIGNKFLKELNPSGSSISKQKIISQIKRLINESYLFMGYREFAGYIHKVAHIDESIQNNNKLSKIQKKKLRKTFDNRLVIIDEVHNIRLMGNSDKHDKKIANSLTKLVKYTNNMRLLLLSGTPMYNHYSEIIWLINLMNLNDNRSAINKNEIFDKDDNFIVDTYGNETGKDLFIHKINGYVSFVRGENPYIFPHRIYPILFDSINSLKSNKYPRFGLNNKPINEPLQHIDLYMTKLSPYQKLVYNYIIDNLKTKADKRGKSFDNLDSFGYNDLQQPLEALNITYPYEDFNENSKTSINQLIGKNGLSQIMNITTENVNENKIKKYEYKENTLKKFGKVFSIAEIEKYSSKIFTICKNIINNEGVILIYSQYIEGGLIPCALTLEELGFTRYGNSKNLFKDKPINENKLKYVMITGDISHSINNNEEINACTNSDNINGDKVKVILISKAGSEGIDLKYIRQVHILEPWYNTSRIEQIIGRAVRNKSHCDLPFNKRNVMLFLYGTMLDSDEESADLYVYRVAEKKSIQIGKISRIIKESCVDCIIHHNQINFTEKNFNKKINIILSNKKAIDYNVGDKPFTNVCDYMSECNYECKPNIKIEDNVNIDTYDKNFIEFNNEKIIKKIKLLFKEHYFITKSNIIKNLNTTNTYPIENIFSALDYLVNDKNELVIDRFGVYGKLINIDEYYLFQPLNIQNTNISIFDRKNLVSFKNNSFIVDQDLQKSNKERSEEKINSASNKVELINSIENKYNMIISQNQFKTTNKDIFNSLNKVYNLLNKQIKPTILNELIIDHLLDTENFKNKVNLLNYLYFNHNLTEFQEKLKYYFDKQTLTHDGISGIYLYNDKISSTYNDRTILFVKQANKWEKAKMTDNNNFKILIANNILKIYDRLNTIFGFISYVDKNDIYVFKTIDAESKHKKRGKRCDQSGKSEIIKIFNKAIGDNKYNISNTKNLTSLELCCFKELIFRYYTYKNENDKIWFVNTHNAYLIELKMNSK